MRIALGSDAPNELTDAIQRVLKSRGHDVSLHGALASDDDSWTHAARGVAEAVASGDAQSGIVCCWTGTGASIAANKVPGIRAALCQDAQTAAGARKWNDANVLALSLRATSLPLGEEILDAWLSESPTDDPKYQAMIKDVESSA
ncbi:MAG: RpiB/LacA/LacB family sugar-phosphate isomerase [Candidatus Eremiobacteraeota bacterium]|nr:RpiB/LacA/LacB family sugar-phosphate isomerase [Candidatus Eremiobacteraeota bacterium]